MKLLFIASALLTVWLSFATYSNGLALLAFIATVTTGWLTWKEGLREKRERNTQTLG